MGSTGSMRIKKTREKLIEGYRKLGQRKFTPTTPKERGLEYE